MELIGHLPAQTASNGALVDVAHGCLYLGNDEQACIAQKAVVLKGCHRHQQNAAGFQSIFKDRSGTPFLEAIKQRWDTSGSFNPLRPLL